MALPGDRPASYAITDGARCKKQPTLSHSNGYVEHLCQCQANLRPAHQWAKRQPACCQGCSPKTQDHQPKNGTGRKSPDDCLETYHAGCQIKARKQKRK